MTFDMTQPITFEVEVANLVLAPQWQALIQQLMSETDTFMIGGIRDGYSRPEMVDTPAITLLLIAEQADSRLPVGMGSIDNGELGMAILKQFQGAGLGQELMNTLLDWASHVGLASVWLDVQTDNQPAVHIYRKFEFMIQGVPRQLTLPNGRETTLQRMIKILEDKES